MLPVTIVELLKFASFLFLVYLFLYVACKIIGYGLGKGVLKAFKNRQNQEKNNDA